MHVSSSSYCRGSPPTFLTGLPTSWASDIISYMLLVLVIIIQEPYYTFPEEHGACQQELVLARQSALHPRLVCRHNCFEHHPLHAFSLGHNARALIRCPRSMHVIRSSYRLGSPPTFLTGLPTSWASDIISYMLLVLVIIIEEPLYVAWGVWRMSTAAPIG